MLTTPEETTFPGEDQALRILLARYALRYHVSGPHRDALIDQTLAALSHDPELVLEGPIEKVVALTMHQVFVSSTALKAKLESQQASKMSNK